MSERKVTLTIEFYADLPDGIEGDEIADTIGDEIIAAIKFSPPAPKPIAGKPDPWEVAAESFQVTGWSDEPLD